MGNLRSGNLGYPRIGLQREWKKALEAHWAGKLTEAELLAAVEQVRLANLRKQQAKGIDFIPVNDFSLYDHMLDTATMFGIVPKRFDYAGGEVPLQTYFAIARGNKDATASEMTKWFNTNYHYIVPELEGAEPVLTVNRPLSAYREAKEKLGIETRPVLIGLYTFVKLSKGYAADELDAWVDRLLPLYAQVLQELEQEGVQWVQIDEPILVTSLVRQEAEKAAAIYERLAKAAPRLNLLLQTYFDAVDHFDVIASIPVAGIGLDFVHGYEGNLRNIERFGFPEDKILGVGLVDGRNVWRSDLQSKLDLLGKLAAAVPFDRMIVQPSSSLLHVPVSVDAETGLDPVLRNALAFADEKLDELTLLVEAANGKEGAADKIAESGAALRALAESPARNRKHVQEAAARVHEQPSKRASAFAERHKIQQEKFKLPFLPTTTIGSFPQTPEVRQARQKWRKGEWSNEQYDAFLRSEVKRWVELQEEIGLDVLVHGEFERTDMVEYFGEKLGGFAFTANGWVQSYGSRCVKPPIIYGDVEFIEPMTVEMSVYAQSLTTKPMKGMLTGPITILNWSFVRDDLPREQVAYQIALALREEVEALEQAGIEMIQVDEPALREGLPLKRGDWEHYLNWAVLAFRLATSTVKDTTQIHTHMCYSEFGDIMDSILALDADVISIETSRSHGELIESFEKRTYNQGIGLGVYDIHSPRVPSTDEMRATIERALQVLDPQLFWVNPDCGLKTRKEPETVASLRNMVEAAKSFRK